MVFDNDPTEAIEICIKNSMSQDNEENGDNNGGRVIFDNTNASHNNSNDTLKEDNDKTGFLAAEDVQIFTKGSNIGNSFDSDYLEPDKGANNNNADNDIDNIDFLQDKLGHQTKGRRIAMYLSERYAWYNPQLQKEKWSKKEENGQEEVKSTVENETKKQNTNETPRNQQQPPSLAKGWAFFEHVTLNRYVIPHDHRSVSVVNQTQEPSKVQKFLYKCFRGDRSLDIAEPGENEVPTKLYSPFHTPMSQLGDFGLGYGLYFSTLRAFAVLALLAGLINIPNIIYFQGEEYSQGQQGVASMLKGSAICTERTWVPCPKCNPIDFDTIGAYSVTRYASGGIIPDETGDLLNVTEYIELDPVTGDFLYTDESLEMLYQDYQIRFSEETIVYEGYGSVECFLDCFGPENLVCGFNGLDDCFLDLFVLGSIPPYGDSAYLGFALKTNCEGATREQGLVNLVTILFFIAGSFAIRARQKRLETSFDEDEQTAQDYSIQIKNPPADAHDPSEWKRFFERNFDCHVTVCTVDVANDDILKHFIERRNIKKQLEGALPPGTKLNMTNLEREAEKAEATHKEKGCLARLISPSIPNLVTSLKEVEEELKVLLAEEKDLPVTNIFITFETERAQREVLSKLTVGSIAVDSNDKGAISDRNYLFRDDLVLDVQEPEEPSSIRWQELNAPPRQIVLRLILTSSMCVIVLALGFVAIMLYYAANGLPFVAGLLTSIFTAAFPMVAKMLTGWELHRSETSRQKWMFIKITLFNVGMTSILISAITPFVATLDNKEGSQAGLIPAVYALFYSQMFFTPLLQLLDPFGHLQRHVIAPRAKTQESMNMNFKGSEVLLAERYANLVKFLFLMVWFCAIYPAIFFMGSFALFVVYFVDRFSLMRTWARTPQVGSQIAHFARNYFSPAAIVFMTVVSSYAWSGFPYDNLCEANDVQLGPEYYQNWTIDIRGDDITLFGKTLYDAPDVLASFEIEPNAQAYQYCNQDLRFKRGRSFPPLARWQDEGLEWMTLDQEHILQFFGWLSVVILGAVVLSFLFRAFRATWRACKGSFKPVGEDQGIKYSDNRSIDSYVPQNQSNSFLHPLLLCDLKGIDPMLFSWRDPDRPYSYYSIADDIKEFMDPSAVKVSHIFSDVQHWPPGGQKDKSWYKGLMDEDGKSGWESMEMNVFSPKHSMTAPHSPKIVDATGTVREASPDRSRPYDEQQAMLAASKSRQTTGTNGEDSGNLEVQMSQINEHLSALSSRAEHFQSAGMASSLATIQRDLKKLLEGSPPGP